MSLTLPILKSIRRLLRASVRHADIARRFDLAVGTISRIASERKLRRRKLHLLTEADLPEDDPPPDYVSSRMRRCPGCGGLVYHWPCLACRLTGRREPGVGGDGEKERRRDRETLPTLPASVCPEGATCDSPGRSPGLGGAAQNHIPAPTGRAQPPRTSTDSSPLWG